MGSSALKQPSIWGILFIVRDFVEGMALPPPKNAHDLSSANLSPHPHL